MSVERKARSALFSRGQPGGPVVIDSANEHPGNIWWVDSGQTSTGSDAVGYGRSPDKPFLTLAYAFSGDHPTANNGDVIYVMPGHAESVIAAGTITQDIAGVKVVGLGGGADRPTFTFSTADTATWLVSAASSHIENVILLSGVNACANNLSITAADCTIKDVEIQDGSATVEFAGSILTDANTDRLLVDGLVYHGFIAGDAAVRVIQLVGNADTTICNSHFYGEVSTAIIDFTTAAHNVLVDNCYFYNDNVALSKNVVDTATGSTWAVSNCYDGKGGYGFSGGSGAGGVAYDDISTVSTAISSNMSKLVIVSGGVSTVDSRLTVTSAGVSSNTSFLTVSSTVLKNTSTGVSTLDSRAVVLSSGVSSNLSKLVIVSAGVSTVDSRLTVTSAGVSSNTSFLTVSSTVLKNTSTGVSSNTSFLTVLSGSVSTLESRLVVIQSYVVSGW